MTEKVSRKVILPYVAKMEAPFKALKAVVESMPVSTAKNAFMLSVDAFEKKFNNYSASAIIIQGENLSDEEKQVLAEFRAKKAAEAAEATAEPAAEPAAESEIALEQTEENSLSADDEQVGKKKRRNR